MGCIGNAPISADFQSAANLSQLASLIIRNDFVLLLSPARPLYWGNSVHSGSRYIIRHTDTVSSTAGLSYKVCRQLYKYTYHFLHIYYNKNFLFFQIKIFTLGSITPQSSHFVLLYRGSSSVVFPYSL